MALKAAVDRILQVDLAKENDWKIVDGETTCRYYVARHHFTEALMKEYWQDRRGYDWNKPLSWKQAKTFLWSLDRQNEYYSDDEDAEDVEHCRYVQSPNVPKEKVREMLKRIREERKKSLIVETGAEGGTESTAKSTLSASVTDTLKAFEDIIGHNDDGGGNKDNQLAKKEEENLKLRHELNECQEQLSMLHSMVKQLKVDMDRTKSGSPVQKPKKKKSKKRIQESSSEDEEEEESLSEEEDEEWSQERGGNQQSDDDETISTFHVNGEGGKPSSQNSRLNTGLRGPTRKNSVHSRRSARRTSVHSVRSRNRQSIRRDSYHSRRSTRGGGMDDGASVVSRQSLASVSPSIKSLPREIELMDEEDTQGKDDYSFFDDSDRRPDDDARSVGSKSAAAKASRRSMVSGQRSRGRNSRKPPQPSTASSKKKSGKGGNVPREIDLSGDELEDETYNNVSNDTSMVTDKQIVDPYGEKGVYTGALSRSTSMPNGKGRLEYEKEGRWYEGDWIHGRWTGYGRLSNGDGDFYQGGLKNDHKHGTGIMRFADGRIFEGEYIRGQMIQGKMTYQDGSVYEGSWVDGMRHGRGKCVFVDGSEYEGEFREGNFHGQGKMTWNDGGWYTGEWSDGEMHGKGKEVRPDGSLRHDGEWSRGQPIRSAADSRRRR
jgi:hypothetical protein